MIYELPLPKISIITPSYNQGEYIEQTIKSVVEQNYPNLEYIIIDGGSSDNTINIIKKYEKFISYWVSEKDQGQSSAINKGYVKASGEIINWLNSDDYYEAGTLSKVGRAFIDPKVSVFSGRSRIFGIAKDRWSTGSDVYSNNLPKTIGRGRIDQPETFFRKSVWDTVGCLNEELHCLMDKDLWIRYLYQYGLQGIHLSEDVLVNFRIHGKSKTNSQQHIFFQEGINLYYTYALHLGAREIANCLEQNFFAKIIKMTNNIECNDKGLVIKALNYSLYFLFLEFYAQNDFKSARTILPYINRDNISNEDLNELFKVESRMKWVSPAFKILFNKIFR
ncbi:MAG: hypothetical protein NVS1B13_14800 [Flavisolibacter sp.]